MDVRCVWYIVMSALLFSNVLLGAQNTPRKSEDLAEQAIKEYKAGKYTAAERDFRELAKRDPSNLNVQVYLGQSLFRQGKYRLAIAPYEKARDLEAAGIKLSRDQHRILVDQLVMSYGISGDLKRSRALLENAIQSDPEYPLNYYNLACVNAEQGNKRELIKDLDLAFEHKEHVLNGEELPDPRNDSSFEKYIHDPAFVSLMKKIGYE